MSVLSYYYEWAVQKSEKYTFNLCFCNKYENLAEVVKQQRETARKTVSELKEFQKLHHFKNVNGKTALVSIEITTEMNNS